MVLEDVARVLQLGTDDSWQNELLRNIGDLRFDGSSMRKTFSAGKSGDWEEFLENDRLSAWRSVKVGECYNGVGEDRQGIAQQIMQKTTDFLRRIIAPVGGQGGDTSSYVCFACHCAPLSTTSGGSLQGTERSNAIFGVRRMAASTSGRTQTGSWSYRTTQRRRCFRPTPRRRECARIL